ncbi:MAG: hypothetical protein LBJ90_05335 [Treponema sp.]|jgi:hypothetical protein|nr:hypothetical protein [Treponema sp.]
MGKGLFIIPALLVPAILFPGFAPSQDGGISAAGRFRAALLAGGIAFEEAPFFPGEAGMYEEEARENGLLLLVRFGGALSRPEYSAEESSPLLVLSVPLTGASDETAYYTALCEEFKKKPPPSVETVIVFSEGAGDPFSASPFGGEDAENEFFAGPDGDSENILFWRLDFEKFPPQSLRIEYAFPGGKAPLFLVEKIPGLCDSLAIPYTLVKNPEDGDEGGAGKDALRVRGLGEGPEETALDAARLSELIGNYAASLDKEGFASGRLGVNADYNYSLIRLPRGVLVISEKTKILAALFSFAVINLAAVILLFIRKGSPG